MGLERSTTANSMASSFAGSSIGSSEYGSNPSVDGRSDAGDLLDEDKDLLQKKATVEHGIFGVLYTLSKEKATSSFRNSVLKILVDFAQLIVFYLDPAFGWSFSYEDVYSVLYNFQLQNPLKDIGYTAWFVVFSLLAVVLCGSVGLCAYVAQNFKTGRFPHVWPIKLLRFFVAVFFTLFYVSALGVFIISFDCNVTGGASAAYNRKFPERKCLSGIMLPAGVVGLLLSVTFTTIAFFMEQAESDQNPLFTDPMGQPSSAVGVRNMLGKTAISVLWIVLIDSSKGLLALIMMCITCFLFFDIVRNVPYYYQVMNFIKGGLYSLLAWFSFLNFLMVYRAKQIQENVFIFLLGTPAALAAGLALIYVRMLRIKRIQNTFLMAAREAIETSDDAKVESMLPNIDHEFWDPLEVELASRVIRAKLKYQTRRRSRKLQLSSKEEAALHMAAQAALLIGLEQFPEESYLQILYGNFLISVCKDSALGYSFLERARGGTTCFEERLMIFTKDRERTQQLGDDSGAAKMDLVRYVEFQNSFSLIKKTHQWSLKTTRRFWRLLLHTNVSFGSLSKAFKEMDTAESKGDRTYKVMIERYPKSSKLLRSYGHFLEDVRNDPWRAQRYFNEADKIDEEAGYEVDSMAGSENTDDLPTDVSHVDDKKYAVVVIKPNGVIRIANEKIAKMFGYKSTELVGKNVNVLMPQPYSQQHNGYLKRYAATGKQNILDMKQKLQGKHKKGHVFPINLLVSKVPGGPSADDVNFMGIFTARKDDEGIGIVSLNKNGIINAFNVACEDFFGISCSKAPGKQFKKCLDPSSVKPFMEALGLAMSSVGEQLERQLNALNKEGNTFPISVTLVADHSGGIVAKVQSLDNVMGMVTIDDVGQIKNANEFVAQMFGHSVAELTSMNISALMPRPYSTFHASYLKRYKSTKKSNIVGDPLGRTVNGLHKSGHLFPINLQVYAMESAEGSNEVLYSGRITLPKSYQDDLRSARCTIRDDGNILLLSEHMETLYGVQPHAFAGRALADLVMELEPTESGLVAAINALEPMATKAQPRKQASNLSSLQSSEHGSSKSLNLDTENFAGEHAGGLTARGVLHYGGTPILVFMSTEATMVPRTSVIQMWAGHLMEGVIEITKSGIMSQATFGIQILFGYREDELVGQNVSMLMPYSVAKHHDMFLERYQEGERRNLIGVRRIVDGMHRDGSPLRLALEVCDTDLGSQVSTHRGERAAFTARVVLSNEPASPTPPEVNAADDKDAPPRGGCAFAPRTPPNSSSDHGMGLPTLNDNPLATLAEGDEDEIASQARISVGPVTEAFNRREREDAGVRGAVDISRSSNGGGGGGGGCPFGFGGNKTNDGGAASAASAPASALPASVGQSVGGCPLMSSRGAGGLPLALQAAIRGGGGGCPFMSEQTMDPGEANAFLRAQGCDVFSEEGGCGPGPVCENFEDDPAAASNPAVPAATSAAPASPAPAVQQQQQQQWRQGDDPSRAQRSKLVRFLTPQQQLQLDEDEVNIPDSLNGQWDEPQTEAEAAYFKEKQMYGDIAPDNYDEYINHEQPKSTLSVMPPPLPLDTYYSNEPADASLVPDPPAVAPDTGRGMRGNASDQSVDAEEAAAEASEKRKAKMRVEVNKAKKARRITKLLSSPEARKAMDRLKNHAKYVIGMLTVAYVIAFTVNQVMGKEHYHVMEEIQTVSLLASAVPIIAVDARVLQSAYDGNGVTVNANASAVRVVMDEMLTQAGIMEDHAQDIYIGEHTAIKPTKAVAKLFEDKDFVTEDWIDAAPMRFEFVTSSFWDAIKLYYQDARKVVHRAEMQLDLSLTRDWRYIIRNGVGRVSGRFDELLEEQKQAAMDNAARIEVVLSCVLAMNLTMFLIILLHFYRLLRKVSDERLGLYTVFISIPRPIVMKLATKKIITGDEDGSDDGSDDEDVVMMKLKKDEKEQQQQQQQQRVHAIDEGPAGAVAKPGGILSKPGAGGALKRSAIDRGVRRDSNAASASESQPPRPTDNHDHNPADVTGSMSSNHDAEARGGALDRLKAMASGVMMMVMNRHRGSAGNNQVAPHEHQHLVEKPFTSSIKFAKSGRTIDPKGSNINTFLIPLLLWGFITILSFAFSYWQFTETNAPARSLAVAARVEVLASSARFYAHELVLAAGFAGHVPLGNRSQDEEIAFLRSRLHNVSEEMFELYENILLGGGKYDLDASLQTASQKRYSLLFDHGCLRLSGEHLSPACVPFGHDFFYRSTAGLDNLLRHYREACQLLALDPTHSLNVTSPRFQFIWEVGMYDVRGGLRTNTKMFLEEVSIPPDRDRIIQICTLVLMLVGKVYFVRYLFIPWFKATKLESHRIAELLAQLPAEIDMHAVIAEQLLMKRDEEIDFNAIK